LNFCSAHHPSPRSYHNGTPPFFTKSGKKGVKKKELFFRSSSRFHFAPPLGSSCLIFYRDKQKHTKKSSVLVLFHVLWFVPEGE